MNARTYTTQLRNGKIVKVKTYTRKSVKPPLPYPDDPDQLALVEWVRAIKMPRNVVSGCEFFRKYDGCEDSNATHQVTVCTGGGTVIAYIVCESCKENFLRDLTPLCNTGSKKIHEEQ